MKHSSISCLLLILSSILLLSQQSYARKDMGGYWKSVMNDQPMPEAIRGLLFQQEHGKNQFVRDFDMRPNLIIYHSAHNHHEQQPAELRPFAKDVKGIHA